MTIEQTLMQRSNSSCELCASTEHLTVYVVEPATEAVVDKCILLCDICIQQIEHPDSVDVNHWRALNDNMWSQIPAVQVMAWRQLTRLSSEPWAQDLLELLYLEEDVLAWAKETDTSDHSTGTDEDPTLDSNGAVLQAGDTVTLIKDLVVKGAGFTAKRGTAVRGISLTSNPEQIEGKINGTRIVLLCKFLKKSN